MGRDLILETTFLVDLERERGGDKSGPAVHFLTAEADSVFFITQVTAGEMAAGASLREREAWESFLAPFRILPANRDVCWEYGRLYRFLQSEGRLIGANDLWIAATALAHQMGLVTHNVEHFRRIPDLEIVPYRRP